MMSILGNIYVRKIFFIISWFLNEKEISSIIQWNDFILSRLYLGIKVIFFIIYKRRFYKSYKKSTFKQVIFGQTIYILPYLNSCYEKGHYNTKFIIVLM